MNQNTPSVTSAAPGVTLGIASLAPSSAQPPVVAPSHSPAEQAGYRLAGDVSQRIDAQVDGFIANLQNEDVNSTGFRDLLQQAFQAGRKQIADATTASNSFTRRNFSDEANSPAYKAITQARELLDSLNPSRQGDLFAPNRILGLIPSPFGSRLKRYARKFQSAETHITAIQGGLGDGREIVRANVNEVTAMQDNLWHSLQLLQGADAFITRLDTKLVALIEQIRQNDSARARAYEDKVLYYVRQNRGDILATQALVLKGTALADILVSTGRELMNSCDRLATLGVAALHIGVTMSRAVGEQAEVRKVAQGTQAAVEELLGSVNAAMKEHVSQSIAMADSPVLTVQRIQALMNDAFALMDQVQEHRVKALGSMAEANATLRSNLDTHMARLANEREASAGNLSGSSAAPALDLDFTVGKGPA